MKFHKKDITIEKIFRKIKSFVSGKPGWLTMEQQKVLSALGPADIAIDCGANVGNITAMMAKKGATVYAFEPNPYAFKKLKERFADFPNVHCVNKGVWNKNGIVKLYLHNLADKDQVLWSVGSSIFPFKGNVEKDNFINIEVIDLAEFISNLAAPVKAIKIDVEGTECDILERLIDTGAIYKIEKMFVETHDQKIPELREPMERIRRRIKGLGLKNISFEWV